MTRMPLPLLSSAPMEAVSMLFNWWDEINESSRWQDGLFYALCASYALVSSVALFQLIRIELRVPEYGWTTQKVFHLMNFIVNGGDSWCLTAFRRLSWYYFPLIVNLNCFGVDADVAVRAIVFGFHSQVFQLHPRARLQFYRDVQTLSAVVSFSEFGLLTSFLTIIEQARSLPTDKLRIVYVSVNAIMYFIQVCIWIYLWIDDNSVVELIGKIFIAVVSFVAALGFLIYGGRLFFMLRRFPIESKGRRKKLHEVGSVTAICFTCFLIRCFVVVLSAFDADASLDVLDHPVLNVIYYMLVEILPSALVLYILRKLPPKRVSAQHHPIR
ncbi:hypothetical protein DVH24_011708 [Malus domestica]|uniref:THH1/TOM1/TOM3 domain-containing protein n=1 Tax=Malus domestica TaxID=3750 RepID=A0A498JZC9_MALDO|nr:hypothetical protein DVH24_011708 [Malus domestica]